MDWTYLGHAMWSIEAAGLRLLCDPLLDATHHCGVFEVVPHRVVDAAALRPDFVFVSHRHPDHFDIASLDRLAQLDPDAVVVTPDPLVVEVARALGFRSVRQVAPGVALELDGVRAVTTPSVDPAEWGLMLACDGAVGWNQVDAVFDGPPDVVRVRDLALAALDARRVDFAAVRWQPMLEIAAQLGESTRFPLAAYDRRLREIAATGARALVPASAGGSHVGPWAWLDRVVFPIAEPRFLRDIAALCPDAAVHPGRIGATWRIDADGVVLRERSAEALVTVEHGTDPRRFHPLDLPALVDPNPTGGDVASMRARVERWLHDDLCHGLAKAGVDRLGPLTLAIEIVWPDRTAFHTITLDAGRVRLEARAEDDWDAINQIAGSLLWEVVEGRRGWGDVLLAGALRARTRAYRITPAGARPIALGETFLYYGLAYDASHERAARWEVARCLAARGTSPLRG